MRACTVSMLEPRQFGFFGGLDVVFRYLRDHLAFLRAELHDLFVVDTAAHVPGQAQIFLPDIVSLLIQPLNVFGDFIGG